MFNVCIISNPNLHANIVEVGHDASKCSKDISNTSL